MLSPYVFVCVRMCLESRVGCGPLGRLLCCVFQDTLVLHDCLVVLRFVFLVPCLGGFLVLFRLMMINCLEQSLIRDSIMAINPAIELEMMCRSSTNIKPAILACFACGALTPQFNFCMFVSMSLYDKK